MLVNKASGGNDNFYNESSPANRSWAPSFKLGTQRSALGHLPADESSFPTATWFREYLGAGIQRFTLNSGAIRQPSPPTRAAGFLPDGSNVSWVAGRLRQDDPARHAAWIAHLRTVLLSSVYGAQVLMATHSPVVLNAANTEQVLCFARDDAGATDIVSGAEHPHLQAWRGDADLGTLLAAGVLG